MVYDFIFGWRAREREPRLRCFNLSKNNSVVASFVIFPRRTRGNAFSGMMKREINWKGNGQGGRKWTEEERRQNCRVPSHGPMTVALLPMSWIPFFLSCFIRNVRTHTERERERERRKISGCIQRNVDLREKVERTEMRERKRRPRWPGDGWDEEKLPSSLSLSSLSLLYNNTQRTNNLKGQRLRQCGCKETDRPRDFLILLLP
jgi:hypothetical protein